MTCYYEGYIDEVLGKAEVVGTRCMDCREHGAYTNCPRFNRIKNGDWGR